MNNTQDLKDQIHILAPKNVTKVTIVRYSRAGTWLMELNSGSLNAWKVPLPKGDYQIVDTPIETSQINKELGNVFVLKKI